MNVLLTPTRLTLLTSLFLLVTGNVTFFESLLAVYHWEGNTLFIFSTVIVLSAIFVLLIAIISLNLGIFNLLPVPILDGGHLLFLLIEACKGSPVSNKAMEVSQQIELALLLALMMFVCYNDVVRLSNGPF